MRTCRTRPPSMVISEPTWTRGSETRQPTGVAQTDRDVEGPSTEAHAGKRAHPGADVRRSSSSRHRWIGGGLPKGADRNICLAYLKVPEGLSHNVGLHHGGERCLLILRSD